MSKTQWYAKSTYVLVALALVLSLGVVAVPMAETVEASPGTHYYVATTGNDTNSGLDWANAWKHISYAAVNVPAGANATDPNVIHVVAGLYDTTHNGETFPITFNNDNVSVIGAGPETSIIDANNAEVNVVEIGTDSVDISGFTIRNAKAKWSSATGNGIHMDGATNCDISNLKIYHMTEGGSDDREPAGIFMKSNSNGNTFSSIEIYDINSDYSPRGIFCHLSSGNQFTDINIYNIDNTDTSVGTRVYGIHLSSSSGNKFDEIRIDSISGGEWANGIWLSWSHNNTFGDLSISNLYGGEFVYGILVCDSNDNTFGSSSEIWNINAESGCAKGIAMVPEHTGSNRNTFESFDIHDTCYGFYIDKSDDTFITKSNIHDNVEGVHICSGMNECVGNKVNCNNIYDNTDYGVYKENPPDVDATNNWWGDASGPSHSPGNGDKISGNVTYDPWLPDEFQYCEECGGAPRQPPPPPGVPTVNHWGIAAMIALFTGLLVWTVRRRRLAS